MGWGAAGDVAPFVSAGYPSGTSHIASYISVAGLIMFENPQLYVETTLACILVAGSPTQELGHPR